MLGRSVGTDGKVMRKKRVKRAREKLGKRVRA
jgi:hypothetical protein